MVVRFVDTGGIVYHHYLNLFIVILVPTESMEC